MFSSLVLGLGPALVNPWPKIVRVDFNKYLFNINNSFNNCFVLINHKRADF
jgi:hypothetical protein